MLALQAYLTTGDSEKKQQVRDLEKFADEQKLHLEKMLSDSFVTPFDREDIYDIAVFLDEIINAAKSTVREMEAMQINPSDSQFSEMTEILVEGTRCINSSFHHLNKNLNEAYQFAQLARRTENRLGKNLSCSNESTLRRRRHQSHFQNNRNISIAFVCVGSY